EQIIKDTEAKVKKIEKAYAEGELSLDEKLDRNIALWKDATDRIQDSVIGVLDQTNPIRMMATSGARGSNKQIMQLSGMRGIIANVSGRKEDVPTKGCYRLGLSPLEYFLSSRGGRKGLADTALKTSDAGYLTRRLVDVAQDVIITEKDCFATLGEKPKGMVMTELRMDGYVKHLASRIKGRYSVRDIVDPNTKKVLVAADTMITDEMADYIEAIGIKEVEVRSVLTCKCKHGICAKCYGRDMSGHGLVSVGEPVGIIAAQSIGEPGTQLTMRTKHSGGIAMSNITEGLPRVEEILEARVPKGAALVSDVGGTVVAVNQVEKRVEVVIKTNEGKEVPYLIPASMKVIAKKGDVVEPGSALTEGVFNPHDILRNKGIKAVQDYLITEIIKVYKTQDISINNKHLEIIVRQMLKKVKIEDAGDTDFQIGSVVNVIEFEHKNLLAINEGKRPARATRVLLSITKAALRTDSFLSAASFQETSSVLVDAAVKSKVDYLQGLKENVIFGKLIPAGTGMKLYQNVGYKNVK
ncbi:MAG: DNA-directed RNA polymerase subunit beta', partial [Clostridia bacterium]|nr:DNA-directed RNA polymerase subunit beta' [Clostridia bacterium]